MIGKLIDYCLLELNIFLKYFFAGLTGIELFTDQDTQISFAHAKISCNIGNDNLMRLVDGYNLTIDENHMWATQSSLDTTVIITIKFHKEVFVTGMKIWNYNASLDLSYCGVIFLSYLFLI